MNFIKRAVLAVTRRKGKSFIMLVLFLAIANMVLARIAIQHATDNANVLARQKLEVSSHSDMIRRVQCKRQGLEVSKDQQFNANL